MSELKPCPFCGGNQVYVPNPDVMTQWCGDDWKEAKVLCPSCGMGVTFRLLHKSVPNTEVIQIAETEWNRRAEQ